MKVVLISIEANLSIFFPIAQELLSEKGHECKYVHMPLTGLGSITKEEIDKIMPDLKRICEGAGLIGLSCMTNTFFGFSKIADSLKPLGIPLLVGGVHPTVRPEECLKHADFVCIGEGEGLIVDFVEKLSKKQSVYDIENLCYLKDGKLIKNRLRSIIKDLNELPVPKFNLKNIYLSNQGSIKPLHNNPNLVRKEFGKYYFIIASRGCPYRCKYCLNDALIKIKPEFALIRKRNKEHVLKELQNLKKCFSKETVIGFVDDDFCARSTADLSDICADYKRLIGKPFFCASTPTSMNEDKVRALINAGLIRLEIGVQSISDKVNHEIYGRYSKKEQLIKTSNMLEKYRKKIAVCYDFILDNPWEGDETRIESLNFALSLKKPVSLFLFSLTLYPGTSLLERAKKEGIIKDEYYEIYRKNHMLLENSYVNTLFVLYTNYKFPKSIIHSLIQLKNFSLTNVLLGRSTMMLFRFSNYLTGLKDSIKLGDSERIRYYLLAPLKSPLKLFSNR